jgi:hypothetical protein
MANDRRKFSSRQSDSPARQRELSHSAGLASRWAASERACFVVPKTTLEREVHAEGGTLGVGVIMQDATGQ